MKCIAAALAVSENLATTYNLFIYVDGLERLQLLNAINKS